MEEKMHTIVLFLWRAFFLSFCICLCFGNLCCAHLYCEWSVMADKKIRMHSSINRAFSSGDTEGSSVDSLYTARWGGTSLHLNTSAEWTYTSSFWYDSWVTLFLLSLFHHWLSTDWTFFAWIFILISVGLFTYTWGDNLALK